MMHGLDMAGVEGSAAKMYDGGRTMVFTRASRQPCRRALLMKCMLWQMRVRLRREFLDLAGPVVGDRYQ